MMTKVPDDRVGPKTQAAEAAAHRVACRETNNQGYYRTGEFLRAKHQQTTFDSGRRFERWALDLVPVAPEWRILDAGCGWGRFTWPLIEDFGVLPEQIMCCDLSEGMLRTAAEEAQRRGKRVEFRVCGLEALPLQTAVVDLAIAAHVLYFLNDIHRGAHELARVVKDDGWALVTTNSDAINPLVIDLHNQALAALDVPVAPEAPSPFSLENGRPYLASAFRSVETHSFEDRTTYPDVQTFVDLYATLGAYRTLMDDQAVPLEKRHRLLDEVSRQARRRLEATEALRSEVLIGAFVCRDPIHWSRGQ
jgi:ubiquinone/menaquinone biosynthesis C-methylase UbiE